MGCNDQLCVYVVHESQNLQTLITWGFKNIGYVLVRCDYKFKWKFYYVSRSRFAENRWLSLLLKIFKTFPKKQKKRE